MNESAQCLGRFGVVIFKHYDYFEIPLIAFIFINVVLTISATLGNGLIIVAILRSENLHTPSYLLITSLAFTDLLIGLIYHPCFIFMSAYFLEQTFQGICDTKLNGATFPSLNIFLAGISVVMNTFISIDRYLALSLRNQYRIHVTKKRVRIAIVVGWLGVLCYIFVFNNFKRYSTERVLSIIPGIILLALTCGFYTKSFITLHCYTAQVQAQQPNQLHGNFDVVKYRKTLKTMAAILGCLLVCSIPTLISAVAYPRFGHTKYTVTAMMISFIMFGANSSINPIIYLTRFTDIRQECRNVLKKAMFC